ncbi:TolC family protein [Desulfoferrobacter suflitae]|uniref:TolC family protein n=1 Tax=Desulfoferrobacter suflitae TaxID=2865782 RepID=UPI00216463C6|nr:TolC family protein [Desulfoferrobacter suflitae]MCK8603759.1 TolC family protein [Desulfoferrobacter suflitae]
MGKNEQSSESWARGREPETTSSPVIALSLKECVRLAVEQNPVLQAAQTEQAIQRLEKPLAISTFLPTLDVEGSYTRFGEKQRIAPAHSNNELGVFDDDLVEAGLVLLLPIFQGGRRIAEYRIAELSGKLATAQLVTTQQDLILNVASVFFKILQTEQVIRAAQASLKALQAQAATIHMMLDVGRAAPVDAMKVDVRVASIEQELSKLQADRHVLLVQLGRLLGADAQQADLWQLTGELEVVPKRLPDMGAAREFAGAHRSELKAAHTQLEQAKKALDVARSEHWPRIDGFARYGVRSGVPFSQSGGADLLDNEDTWSVGVAMDIPLFRGGAIQTRVSQAALRIRQAEQTMRDVKLRIDEDLDRSLTELADSMNRLQVTEKNVTAAAETLRIEQLRYAEGRNTINDVLDAQSAMLRADVEYSQAVVDYLLARIGWERSKGEDLQAFIDRWETGS